MLNNLRLMQEVHSLCRGGSRGFLGAVCVCVEEWGGGGVRGGRGKGSI